MSKKRFGEKKYIKHMQKFTDAIDEFATKFIDEANDSKKSEPIRLRGKYE